MRAHSAHKTRQTNSNIIVNSSIFSFLVARVAVGPSRSVVRAYFGCEDQERIKEIYEKITYLYDRIVKAHENVENVLESIMIWGNVPLYQRKDINSTNSLLDIDERSVKCRNRSYEVGVSKKLIEYTMEENYRLLFDLPRLVRQPAGGGKNRLKKTIMRQFGRHQATDKIRRMSSLVGSARSTHILRTLASTYTGRIECQN